MKNKDEGLTSSPNDSNAPVVCCLSQTEIEECDKIIAKFIGYKEFKSFNGGVGLCTNEKDMSTWIEFNRLKYHSSWDWLMPVYKKCYDIWIPNLKENKRCAEIFEDIWHSLWKYDFENFYLEIVEFIKWYNNHVVSER